MTDGIGSPRALRRAGTGCCRRAPRRLKRNKRQRPPPQPGLADRIATRAQENRHRLEFDGATFSGPHGICCHEGRQAQFFCLGEEHGIAENPKLAAQLFAALEP